MPVVNHIGVVPSEKKKKKNLVQNIKFWLSVSFRSPKRSQFGHGRFIFQSTEVVGRLSWTEGLGKSGRRHTRGCQD